MPYAYAFAGITLMLLSYFDGRGIWPTLAGVAGLFAVIGGVVIILKRRDYRINHAHYDYRSLD